MESYVTPLELISLLAPPVAGAALATCAVVFYQPKPVAGWRSISPGLGYWIALLLCLALSVLIAWVWAFIGSSRVDGAFQMRVAWWLALIFGCGAAFAGQRIVRLYRQALRWRGDALAWNGSSGNVPMRSLVSLQTDVFGFAQARFEGGRTLSVDLAAAGASDLVERLEDVNGLGPEDRPGEH
jgi:hypothetical protein